MCIFFRSFSSTNLNVNWLINIRSRDIISPYTDISACITWFLRLSRYKRAAVLTYAILVADPLCKLDGSSLDLDPLFLKQRLAFYLALSSIIQDFDEGRIKEILRNEKRPVFQLAGLGESDRGKELDDDFCMSLYKDLFFSEYYGNYNILTMAKQNPQF